MGTCLYVFDYKLLVFDYKLKFPISSPKKPSLQSKKSVYSPYLIVI